MRAEQNHSNWFLLMFSLYFHCIFNRFQIEICGGGRGSDFTCPNFRFSQIEFIFGLFRIIADSPPKMSSQLQIFFEIQSFNMLEIFLFFFPKFASAGQAAFNDRKTALQSFCRPGLASPGPRRRAPF